MLHIFTALYCEAHIFIRQFKLVKNQENTCFQEFYNEAAGVRLTVTGVGEIAAAAAVSSAYTAYRPAPEDFLLNVGICAHPARKDGIFLCNQIREDATGKTFYPDMLYRHSFCEGTIITTMQPWYNVKTRTRVHTAIPSWNSGHDSIGIPAQDNTEMPLRHNNNDSTAIMSPETITENLYDMEAAAIYQAGSRFLGPHQMLFLKIVSDNGAAQNVSSEQVIQLMEKYHDCIFDYAGQLSAISQEQRGSQNHLRSDEETLLETFCADLHCSKAMRDSMRQYIRYLSLAGINYTALIQDMYKKGLLPCKDKREGKLRFEEFKQRIF